MQGLSRVPVGASHSRGTPAYSQINHAKDVRKLHPPEAVFALNTVCQEVTVQVTSLCRVMKL